MGVSYPIAIYLKGVPMNEILLSQEVIIYLLSETLLYILLLLAALATVSIVRRWDFSHFDALQFRLENRSYLVMSVIAFVILLKVVLLPYFVYTIDALADLVPGAMCAAGVIKANDYGDPLLVIKIIILFLSGIWLSVNRLDLEAKTYPYLKLKSWFFLGIFLLLTAEFMLDWFYFSHIRIDRPVSCCSVIFGQLGGRNGLPLGLDIPKLLILFYLLFGLSIMTLWANIYRLALFVIPFFGVIAYYAVVYFFGTYVYELPTHQCPFCMLQSHYHYVGYLIWGSLLIGLFLALDHTLLHLLFRQGSEKIKRVSLLFLILFVTVCSSYVLIYYLKNGVLL